MAAMIESLAEIGGGDAIVLVSPDRKKGPDVQEEESTRAQIVLMLYST